jgi:hypothetical protein
MESKSQRNKPEESMMPLEGLRILRDKRESRRSPQNKPEVSLIPTEESMIPQKPKASMIPQERSKASMMLRSTLKVLMIL